MNFTLRCVSVSVVLSIVGSSFGGTIQGRATDLQSQSLGSVQITIERSDDNRVVQQRDSRGNLVDSTFSGDDGAFAISVPDNVFVVVTFSLEGRVSGILQHINGSVNATIDVALPKLPQSLACRSHHSSCDGIATNLRPDRPLRREPARRRVVNNLRPVTRVTPEVIATPPPLRWWTNRTGTKVVAARLVRLAEGKAYFERRNKRICATALADLSIVDQAWIRNARLGPSPRVGRNPSSAL